MKLSAFNIIAVLVVATGAQEDNDNFLAGYTQKHFLQLVNNQLSKSVEYLLAGNIFGDQSFQRPGIAKLLKEESDRQWGLARDFLRKYAQRGGVTPISRFRSIDEGVFHGLFSLQANVDWLNNVLKSSPDFTVTYVAQLEQLTTDCQNTAEKENELFRAATKSRIDADFAHYLSEKMEEEVKECRKLQLLHKNVQRMSDTGMAQHMFDHNL